MLASRLKEWDSTTATNQYCSEWLDYKAGELVRQLTVDPELNEQRLWWLMSYELHDQRREYLMKKLYTRFCKLRKNREWEDLQRWLR